MTALLWIAFALAVLPTVLILVNLNALRPPPASARPRGLVSVLIPARNEEGRIAAALEAVLASRHALIEVLVLNDHSSDATAAIVASFARRDPRVRLLDGQRLPTRGCGKPFACAQLADAARAETLLFVDADVRLASDAVGRIAAALESGRAALLSGVPRQTARTPSEKVIVPLIHFVLLGHLPIPAMRRTLSPAFGAACGQLVAVKRCAYRACGGHRAVLTSFHDGVTLARRLRACGFGTDLADLTRLAECRMYQGFGAVVTGFAKNAHEGLGSGRAVVPWTVLLLSGQVLPPAALLAAPWRPEWLLPAACAVAASYLGRALLARRFERGWAGAALHPLGITALVAIQWYALARRALGRPVRWKGRSPAAARRVHGDGLSTPDHGADGMSYNSRSFRAPNLHEPPLDRVGRLHDQICPDSKNTNGGSQ